MVFRPRVPQIHRRIPLLLHGIGPSVPFLVFERIKLIVGLSGREVEHQGADGVGVAVHEVVQISRPLGSWWQ